MDAVQEVIRGENEAVQPQEYTGMGLVTEFGVCSELHAHVQPGMLQFLRTLGPSWNLLPSDSAMVFVDNHDRQRGSPGPPPCMHDVWYLYGVVLLILCST